MESLALTVRTLSWPGIELRHLSALCGIAAQRSFGRAATSLGYTQSAISQQIASLERAVGHRLLERAQGRGPVELTPAGRLVLRHAEAMARELSLTRASLDALADVEHELAVGVHRVTGLRLLPEIVGRMGTDAPRLRLHESSDDAHLLALVGYDELDLAFVHLPVPPELAAVELVHEPYVAVAARPLAQELGTEPIGPESLVRLPLLLLHAPRAHLELDRYFDSAGVSLAAAFESEDPSMLCELAERGLGVALLPHSLATQSGRDLHLLALSEAPTRRLGIAWREDAPRSRHLRSRFIAAAADALREPVQARPLLAKVG